jgi:hypothetical protein
LARPGINLIGAVSGVVFSGVKIGNRLP